MMTKVAPSKVGPSLREGHSTLSLQSTIDIVTSRDGSCYRADAAHGHVAIAQTELAAATACARKALTCVSEVLRIVSCDESRSHTGLFQATNRTVRSL